MLAQGFMAVYCCIQPRDVVEIVCHCMCVLRKLKNLWTCLGVSGQPSSSHGWEKLVQEKDDLAAIDRLVTKFALPLQGAQADTTVIKAEFGNMMEYAVQYIAITSLDYQSV